MAEITTNEPSEVNYLVRFALKVISELQALAQGGEVTISFKVFRHSLFLCIMQTDEEDPFTSYIISESGGRLEGAHRQSMHGEIAAIVLDDLAEDAEDCLVFAFGHVLSLAIRDVESRTKVPSHYVMPYSRESVPLKTRANDLLEALNSWCNGRSKAEPSRDHDDGKVVDLRDARNKRGR